MAVTQIQFLLKLVKLMLLWLKVLAVTQNLIFMHFAASAVAGGRKVLLVTFNGLTVLG